MTDPDHVSGRWVSRDQDRLIEPGHSAGDFLDAPSWRLLEERVGYLRVEADLPERALNPRGQLFGGFTPTYVDLISLLAVRAGPDRTDPDIPRVWLSTINLRLDYLAPITGPTFEVEAEVQHLTSKIAIVDAKFFQDGELAAMAHTTMRVLPA